MDGAGRRDRGPAVQGRKAADQSDSRRLLQRRDPAVRREVANHIECLRDLLSALMRSKSNEGSAGRSDAPDVRPTDALAADQRADGVLKIARQSTRDRKARGSLGLTPLGPSPGE